MQSTRNLLLKTFAYERQTLWDLVDGLKPMISPSALNDLRTKLQQRPPSEVLQAAQELNINLDKINAC